MPDVVDLENKAHGAVRNPAYGVPTNVVTLCASSVTLTREAVTLTAVSGVRSSVAEVSYGVSEHGALAET